MTRMTVVVSARSNGVGDASRHLVRRTDMLPELGSIIFLPFRDPRHDALLQSGAAASHKVMTPEPGCEAAAGVLIPRLSNRLHEKALTRLANIKLYGIVYWRGDFS
jgi:hypothetical protein